MTDDKRKKDLQWLLGDFDKEVFLCDCLEKKPLLLKRGVMEYYRNILTLGDIEKILYREQGISKSTIRLISASGSIPAYHYQKNERVANVTVTTGVDLDRILHFYKDEKATIVIENIVDSWDPLLDHCTLLDQDLLCPVGANVYVTPPYAQGFAPHYDTHDVFILQIHGSKQWRIYENPDPVTLPLGSQKGLPFNYEALVPIYDVEVQPGDFIYIPRGYIHEAVTSDEISAHVTLGAYTTTWAKMLLDLIRHLAIDEPVFNAACRWNDLHTVNPGEDQLRKIKAIIHKHLTLETLSRMFENGRELHNDKSVFTAEKISLSI